MTFHSNRTVTKAKISIKEWDIFRAGQTMLFVGRMWTLGLEKVVEQFKWDLQSYPSKCLNLG